MADYLRARRSGWLTTAPIQKTACRKMKKQKYLHKYSLYLIVSTVLLLPTSQVKSTNELHYALFTSGPYEGGFDSSGVIPAIELAEDEIFKDPFTLKGFRLTHTPVQDTMCNRTRSLDLFFATVTQATPPVLGLLGCGCSVASELVAEIIHHWNISQVAYSSTATTLNDRQRFVNFTPSDKYLAPALLSLLQFYGWSRILFITQEHGLFIRVYENLSQEMEARNITFRNSIVPNAIPAALCSSGDLFFPDDDIRVIFINANSDVARVVLCEAMKVHNIVGYPRYIWITYAWYQEGWWTSAVNDDSIGCSEDELVQLLRLSLSVQIVPVSDNPNAQTDVGLTTNEFNEQYMKRFTAQENNHIFSLILAAIAYDAVWSFALALNHTTIMLEWPKYEITNETSCQDDGTDLNGFELDDFTYNHTFVGCIIRWNLAQTNFAGVSGQVNFNENGTREQNQITVLQYRVTDNNEGISQVAFGSINTQDNFSFEYVNNEGNDTTFPDGIPSDGTPLEVISHFHLALVIIYDILAFLGLVYTTVCLVFNFVFRKRKVIRLTSPNLNYFIIAGSYIMYISIFIRVMPSTAETVNYVRCNLQPILNVSAYCLAFGTVLVKMGRICRVYSNPFKKEQKGLTDKHMAVIVSTITGVGVLIPVLGWAIPALRAIPSVQPDEERMFGENEVGVRIIYLVWQCAPGNNSHITNIGIFLYLALVQVAAIILAIQTRRVKVKVLNDSKYIIALIYISSVVLLLLIVVTFTLGVLNNVNEVLVSGAFLISTTAFLSLTFIPKMVSLYRDPLGEDIFADHLQTVNVSRDGTIIIMDKDDKLLELEARVKQLENLLEESKNSCSSCHLRSVINSTIANVHVGTQVGCSDERS